MVKSMTCDSFTTQFELNHLSRSSFATRILDETHSDGDTLHAAIRMKVANRLKRNNPEGEPFILEAVNHEEMLLDFN